MGFFYSFWRRSSSKKAYQAVHSPLSSWMANLQGIIVRLLYVNCHPSLENRTNIMSLITLFLAHFAQHKTPFNKLSRWLEDVGQKKDEETIPHSSPTTQPRVDGRIQSSLSWSQKIFLHLSFYKKVWHKAQSTREITDQNQAERHQESINAISNVCRPLNYVSNSPYMWGLPNLIFIHFSN